MVGCSASFMTPSSFGGCFRRLLCGTECGGLPERLHRLSNRQELVGKKPGEANFGNCPGNSRVVKLLTTVYLVPAGHPAGVKVCNELAVLLDCVNNVALH